MKVTRWPRLAGLALGLVADRLVADPQRWHPVAGMGTAATAVEAATYGTSGSRVRGVGYTAILVGGAAGVGYTGSRAVRGHPVAEALLTGAVCWVVLGGDGLARVGGNLADAIDTADLDAARRWIPYLCGRDPQALDAPAMLRAALESVAENTSDAAVAPLVWGGIAGIPGLVTYRMINTLDAMVGYRNARYSSFGWASARLDDLANLLPARVTAASVVALGADRGGALRAWRRQAGNHPSPNAGVVEAAFAGALGVQLGGATVYAHGVEMRPILGAGGPPSSDDLRAAAALSRRVAWCAWGLVSAAVAIGEFVARRSVVARPHSDA